MFPDPIRHCQRVNLSLLVTNKGPLAIPANWILVGSTNGLGGMRLLTRSVGTNVLSPYQTFYDLGPLAAGASRTFEVAFTAHIGSGRDVTAHQRFSGQAYRAVSEVAAFLFIRDGDADGLEDWWEIYYDLNPLNPADASGDADGDGSSNLDEYLWGTDPRNPMDLAKIPWFDFYPQGSSIKFLGKPGRTYGLFRRSGLDAPWTEVSRITADSRLVSFFDSSPPKDAAFYQIQLLPKP